MRWETDFVSRFHFFSNFGLALTHGATGSLMQRPDNYSEHLALKRLAAYAGLPRPNRFPGGSMLTADMGFIAFNTSQAPKT